MANLTEDETRFEKCDCEHTRMEHGDGECESILLAHGGEYRCTCKRFVRTGENV